MEIEKKRFAIELRQSRDSHSLNGDLPLLFQTDEEGLLEEKGLKFY